MNHNRNEFASGRFKRSRDNRYLGGIMGGLSDHFGFSSGWLRLALLMTFIFMPYMALAYLLLVFIIPVEQKSEDEPVFQQRVPTSVQNRKERLHKLEAHFKKIDLQLQRLESYVATPEFGLRSDINRL